MFSCKRMGLRCGLPALAVGLFLYCATVSAQAAGAPQSLLQAWLAMPNQAATAWPYAYVVAQSTVQTQEQARKDLFTEFKRLSWRLKADGYPHLLNTVQTWRRQLRTITRFRHPGDWSPAFLLSHPYRNPPIGKLAAIGVCDVPNFVGVWSASGYVSIPWTSGMKLSDLEKRVPALRHGSKPRIAVVDPYGHVDYYGVQAWNYADGHVAPGTQVVASLPLKGKAFAWIRDAIASLLAHAPSGVNCREQKISGEASRDGSRS